MEGGMWRGGDGREGGREERERDRTEKKKQVQ